MERGKLRTQIESASELERRFEPTRLSLDDLTDLLAPIGDVLPEPNLLKNQLFELHSSKGYSINEFGSVIITVMSRRQDGLDDRLDGVTVTKITQPFFGQSDRLSDVIMQNKRIGFYDVEYRNLTHHLPDMWDSPVPEHATDEERQNCVKQPADYEFRGNIAKDLWSLLLKEAKDKFDNDLENLVLAVNTFQPFYNYAEDNYFMARQLAGTVQQTKAHNNYMQDVFQELNVTTDDESEAIERMLDDSMPTTIDLFRTSGEQSLTYKKEAYHNRIKGYSGEDIDVSNAKLQETIHDFTLDIELVRDEGFLKPDEFDQLSREIAAARTAWSYVDERLIVQELRILQSNFQQVMLARLQQHDAMKQLSDT